MTMPFKIVKPDSLAEKTTKTTVDTIAVTEAVATGWKNPPFQRQLKVNAKVKALAEEMKVTAVFPGIMTIGVLGGEKYLLDGQHRREAFLLSGLKEAYADVRFHFCQSMAEMGEEFVMLNSSLVRLRADDILRGLEETYPQLRKVRLKCPFVGYGQVRRSGDKNAQLLSMSVVLRYWRGAEGQCPTPNPHGRSTASAVADMPAADIDQMIGFLTLCKEAWGSDSEYSRLWSSANLMICAWIYRHGVLAKWSAKATKITPDMFRQCLMALSAGIPGARYMEWLAGRSTNERDRAPTYHRVKAIFAAKLQDITGVRAALPAPPWAPSH